jgi:hypothetical protein
MLDHRIGLGVGDVQPLVQLHHQRGQQLRVRLRHCPRDGSQVIKKITCLYFTFHHTSFFYTKQQSYRYLSLKTLYPGGIRTWAFYRRGGCDDNGAKALSTQGLRCNFTCLFK